MNDIEVKIVNAVKPFVSEIAPDVYEGQALTYCVYNYDLIGRDYAESKPIEYIALVQVHLYLPRGIKSLQTRLNLAEALSTIGTYPDITSSSDGDGQHFIFEFEMMQNVT